MSRCRRLALGALVALTAAVPASAHIDVLPTQVPAGTAQEFTIRVPTEGDVATVGVRVEIPKDVVVFSFAPPPAGWTVNPINASDGTFAAVDYRGGSVGPQRYIEFRLLGSPRTVGTALWPATQRFADGTRKRWTGPPDRPGESSPETGPETPGPSAAVQIVAAGTATPGATGGGGSAERTSSSAGIWLGVVAIAFAALAALGTGLLWSTRPMRLPEDDPSE